MWCNKRSGNAIAASRARSIKKSRVLLNSIVGFSAASLPVVPETQQQALAFVTGQILQCVAPVEHLDLFQSSRGSAGICKDQFVDNVPPSIRSLERPGIGCERRGNQRRELIRP